MSNTMKFSSEEELAKYLLNRLLPHCSSYTERIKAAFYAAIVARKLWIKHSNNANNST